MNVKTRLQEIGNLIHSFKDIATATERAELIRYLRFELGILKIRAFDTKNRDIKPLPNTKKPATIKINEDFRR